MTTRISVSTRHQWFQLSMHPLGSAEIAERMRLIAEFDLRRFRNWATVVVTATEVETGLTRSLTLSDAPPCPHCGRLQSVSLD